MWSCGRSENCNDRVCLARHSRNNSCQREVVGDDTAGDVLHPCLWQLLADVWFERQTQKKATVWSPLCTCTTDDDISLLRQGSFKQVFKSLICYLPHSKFPNTKLYSRKSNAHIWCVMLSTSFYCVCILVCILIKLVHNPVKRHLSPFGGGVIMVCAAGWPVYSTWAGRPPYHPAADGGVKCVEQKMMFTLRQ